MSTIVGEVAKLEGIVRAINPVTGEVRVLEPGSPVFAGEIIQTSGKGGVVVGMVNGTLLTLGRDTQMRLDDDVSGKASTVDSGTEGAVDIAALQQAILEGNFDALEATAAGDAFVVGSASDGGVFVERIGLEGQVTSGFDTSTENQVFNETPRFVGESRAALVDGDESVTTTEDTPVSGNVLDNVTDADSTSHSVTGFTIEGNSYAPGATANVTGGTLTIAANGAYTFTPDANFNGDMPQATYSIVDNNDASDTDTSTLSISVSPVNDGPIAVDDNASVNEDSTLIIDFANGVIQSNDSDVDGDALTVTEIRTGQESGSGSAGLIAVPLVGTYGTLTIADDGSYSYVADQSAANALQAGQQATDTFTYTISDGEGGTDTAELVITVTGTNDAPVVGSESVRVSEEGIANAIADTTGSSDTTDANSVSGTISIIDVDTSDVLTVTIAPPTTAITSNDVAVSWSGDGSVANPLIGSAAGSEVIRAEIDTSGNYTVTLSGPVDHTAGDNIEGELALDFGISVNDGTVTVNNNLTVTIEDDQPVSGNITQNIEIGSLDTNLMFIVDTSGSMGWDADTGKTTITTVERMELLLKSIKQVIESYDDMGDIKVQFVTFDSGTDSTHQVQWFTADEALEFIGDGTSATRDPVLEPAGGTDYDQAVLEAKDGYTAPGKIDGSSGTPFQNVTYFLSDGQPQTAGGTEGTDGITGVEVGEWTNWLVANDVDAYAVGFGSGLDAGDQAFLDPLAYDGINNAERDGVIVTDANQLAAELLSTIQPPLIGNILGTLDSDGFGADDGHFLDITLDSVTYTFNPDANGGAGEISVSSGGTISGVELNIDTLQGGNLNLNFATGEYVYAPDAGLKQGETDSESFTFTAVDNDGDTTTGTVDLNISREAPPLSDILSDNRVASWTFTVNADDVSQSGTAKDDGTLKNGASISNGVLSLDGNDDYVSIENSNDINLGEHDTRTVLFTFKADPAGTGTQVIFEEGAGTRGLNIYLDDSGNVTVGGWNKNEAAWDGDWITTSGSDYRDGEWHQVALVLDASANPTVTDPANTMTGYIDGASFGVATDVSQLWAHGGDNRIGSSTDTLINNVTISGSGNFKGEIAKGEIYDIALDASQISGVFDLTIQNGVLIDGIVIGLEYTTSSGMSGMTDADGGFEYLEGDVVTFSIGNVVLGQLDTNELSSEAAFLQDLAGVGITNLNDEYLENMAVLLQSLDSNSNPYDGIEISQAVKDAFADDSFDLKTISEEDLASILSENGYTAVSEDDAMQHVKDMLIEHAGILESDFEARVSDQDVTETVITASDIEKLGNNNKGEETAIKSFDFGSENAGKAITVSFESSQNGNNNKFEQNDEFKLIANGTVVDSMHPDVSNVHEYQLTLDENGEVELEFIVDSDKKSEYLNITEIKTIMNGEVQPLSSSEDSANLIDDIPENDIGTEQGSKDTGSKDTGSKDTGSKDQGSKDQGSKDHGPQGNNGFGNGDQDAPGNSEENNNAENASDNSFLHEDDGDIYEIAAGSEVSTITDFDIDEDTLDLSEVITDENITEETLSDYLDFSKVDSDGDGKKDDTKLSIDADGDSKTTDDVTTVYIADTKIQNNDLDDLNIDFQND